MKLYLRVLLLISIITIVFFNVGFYNPWKNVKKEFTTKETIKESIEDTDTIELDNSTGDIEIRPSVNNELTVIAEKIVRKAKDTVSKDLLGRTKILLSKNGNKTIIVAVDKNDMKTNIFDMKLRKYGSMTELNINYILEVPLCINRFDIKVGLGDIVIKGNRSGSFNLNVNMGSITANEIQVTENADFKVDQGEINTQFINIDKAKKISLRSNIGDIKMSIPKDAKCTIETNAFMKEKQRDNYNGGGTYIKAEASLGNINIEFK